MGSDFYEVFVNRFNILKNNTRIISFSSDDKCLQLDSNGRNGYGHPRLWAQYGENHKGICLLFSKEKITKTINTKLTPYKNKWVQAIDYIPQSVEKCKERITITPNETKDLYQFFINNYEQIFFTKMKDWESESESRAVVFPVEENNEDLYIPIEESIRGIIVGVDFPFTYNSIIDTYCNKYKISADHVQWDYGTVVLQHQIYTS